MKIETGLEKKIIEAIPLPPTEIPGPLTHPPGISTPFHGGDMDIFWNYTLFSRDILLILQWDSKCWPCCGLRMQHWVWYSVGYNRHRRGGYWCFWCKAQHTCHVMLQAPISAPCNICCGEQEQDIEYNRLYRYANKWQGILKSSPNLQFKRFEKLSMLFCHLQAVVWVKY